MRVSEIRVNQIRVNQGLGVISKEYKASVKRFIFLISLVDSAGSMNSFKLCKERKKFSFKVNSVKGLWLGQLLKKTRTY